MVKASDLLWFVTSVVDDFVRQTIEEDRNEENYTLKGIKGMLALTRQGQMSQYL